MGWFEDHQDELGPDATSADYARALNPGYQAPAGATMNEWGYYTSPDGNLSPGQQTPGMQGFTPTAYSAAGPTAAGSGGHGTSTTTQRVYTPEEQDFLRRNPGDEGRMAQALGNYTGDRAFDSQGAYYDQATNQLTAAGRAALASSGSVNPAVTGTASSAMGTGTPVGASGSDAGGGSSYGAIFGGDFGAAPAPFGETYAPLARPSYLQGEYRPGTWSETFAAPEKPEALRSPYALPERPEALRTPYTLPTQAELESSAGYQAGSSLMQRGMERSAAARGSVLSGGFVGRTLPRALGEYAGSAYGNLVGQTMGARQQNVGEYDALVGQTLGERQQQTGEYDTDVNRAFDQYRQRYGQFADAQTLQMGARNTNEAAFQADESTNQAGYKTRYGQYLDTAGMKRQSENDLWSRNQSLVDNSLRAAALARPF